VNEIIKLSHYTTYYHKLDTCCCLFYRDYHFNLCLMCFVAVCDSVFRLHLTMLLIIACLAVSLLAMFFLFADGDLTLMLTERLGHKAGEGINIL